MKISQNFYFKFIKEDKLSEIDEPIQSLLDEELNYEEVAFNLIKKYKIPCNYHSEFFDLMKSFIQDELEKQDNQRFKELQEKFHCNYAVNKSRVLLELNKLNSLYLEEKNDSCLVSKEQKAEFRRKYHELIHSGSITKSLVTLEYSFALELSSIVLSKDAAIEELKEKQAIEIEKYIKNIGKTVNEEDVNLLSFQHFQASEALKNYWDKKILKCKQSQKKQFTYWIFTIYDDFKEGKTDEILKKLEYCANSINKDLIKNLNLNSDQESIESPLQESFTINLGSQLKSSHNLRLTAVNILDLCKINFNPSIIPNPHRIQTAMSLYSNMLSAMVLIVDNRISSYTGIKNQFSKLCTLSTEFHFDELEDQLEKIKHESYLYPINSRDSKENLNNQNQLEPGDFYITKHSNLSLVHVVYHLVADDTLYSSEINSRHSVILGLRNILKTSHLNDVTTILIPLLLVNELSESMTLQWCIKRAELVLKCLKGFMIEISSLTPSNDENNNKTIQFVVPSSISEDFFQNLASMLSSIFRMSNPLVLNDLKL